MSWRARSTKEARAEVLQALVAGTGDAEAFALLAQDRLREKLPDLERALTGRVAPHLPGDGTGHHALGSRSFDESAMNATAIWASAVSCAGTRTWATRPPTEPAA